MTRSRAAVLLIGSLAATVLLFAAPVTPAGEVAIGIRYVSPTTDGGNRERTFRIARGQALVVSDLDREDTIEGALVFLPGPAGAAAACRVQSQYETSLTIPAGAPGSALLDWIHYTSDWADAKKTGAREFRLPILTEAERRRFPDPAAIEQGDAVRLSQGGEEWAALMTSLGPPAAPATVGVSAIRVRVACGSGPGTAILATVEFRIPAGC